MSASETNNQEIDLIELWNAIWSKRKQIIKWALIGAIVGLVVGFSLPAEYKTKAKLLPEENESSKLSNMSGLAALAGFDLSGLSAGSGGISVKIYPDIIKSTPFLIEMSQIPVTTGKGESFFLYEYIQQDIRSPWWSYVLRSPFMLMGWVRSLGKEKTEESFDQINPYQLTRSQSSLLSEIEKRIEIGTDKKTELLTVAAEMQDPFVSATVCDSLTVKLEEYVARYRTEKAKRNLEFIKELHVDTREHYYEAQRNYAAYVDVTQNTVLQSVRIEQERLSNEQSRALSLYNQMSQQLEAAKIKVQEDTPILTLIEPASIPLDKTGYGKSALLILFAFIFTLGAVGVITIKFLLKQEKA